MPFAPETDLRVSLVVTLLGDRAASVKAREATVLLTVAVELDARAVRVAPEPSSFAATMPIASLGFDAALAIEISPQPVRLTVVDSDSSTLTSIESWSWSRIIDAPMLPQRSVK